MKCKLLVAWFGVLLVSTPAVRAGLIGSASADAQAHGVQSATDLASQPQTPLCALPSQHLLAPALLERHGIATTLPPELADDFGSDSESGQLTTLPPAPDSAVLALSGLLSLGAIQLGRNVRKLHLGTLPEWYHDGGPAQVGHATPLDLEFSLSAMPICRLEALVATGDAEPSPWWRLRLGPRERLDPQHFLIIAHPRGPPGQS